METKPNVELFDRIIEKTLDALRKHGAEFIVKKNNGDIITHGDSLKLHVDEPPPPAPVKKPRVFSVKMGTYKVIYSDVMDCMEPGDSYTFDVPEDLDAESVRGAACGYATRKWGHKSYTTNINPAAKQFTVRRFHTKYVPDDFSKTVQQLHDTYKEQLWRYAQ